MGDVSPALKIYSTEKSNENRGYQFWAVSVQFDVVILWECATVLVEIKCTTVIIYVEISGILSYYGVS